LEIRAFFSRVSPVLAENSVLVASVDVAADRGHASGTMMSVFLSLFQTPRTWAHSRAALQFEILALRHQLQVMQRTRPRRLRIARDGEGRW
jgi:hypothetical protein